MVSHDYTREVGLPSGEKKVSKPVAAIALAIIAGGIWLAVAELGVPAVHRASAAQAEAPAASH